VSLFIATGSNIGDRKNHLDQAKIKLISHFQLIAESRIYQSPAVDYLNQPDFYNQVLEFELPLHSPLTTITLLLSIENELGRSRNISKGPRVIDLDILFWGNQIIEFENLIIPHPRLFERSFVVLPLSELPGFNNLKNEFKFIFSFDNSATPISSLT